MNNEWNIHFLLNSYIGIQNIYSSKFSIGWSTYEMLHFSWCEVVQSIFFNILHILKSYPRMGDQLTNLQLHPVYQAKQSLVKTNRKCVIF